MSEGEHWIGFEVMLLVIGYAGCRVVMELWEAFVSFWNDDPFADTHKKLQKVSKSSKRR